MTANEVAAISIKSMRQLGFRQVSLYAWYHALLKTGYYTRLRPPAAWHAAPSTLAGLWSLTPDSAQLQALLGPHAASLLAEADEIVAGQAICPA